jgi:hypothetical protein
MVIMIVGLINGNHDNVPVHSFEPGLPPWSDAWTPRASSHETFVLADIWSWHAVDRNRLPGYLL